MDNELTKAPIIGYLLHDAVGNMEAVITDYSEDLLKQAEAAGMQFIAVRSDETRELVSREDVSEPQPQVNGVTLCQPEYVDERIDAVLEAFDAISAIFEPLTSALSKLKITGIDLGDLTTALDKLRSFKATEAATESEADDGDNA